MRGLQQALEMQAEAFARSAADLRANSIAPRAVDDLRSALVKLTGQVDSLQSALSSVSGQASGARAAADAAAAKASKAAQSAVAAEEEVGSLRYALFGSRRTGASNGDDGSGGGAGGALTVLQATGGSLASRMDSMERNIESLSGGQRNACRALPNACCVEFSYLGRYQTRRYFSAAHRALVALRLVSAFGPHAPQTIFDSCAAHSVPSQTLWTARPAPRRLTCCPLSWLR